MESVLPLVLGIKLQAYMANALPAAPSCWPLVFIVVKGFSCISGAKFSVR